MAATSEPHDLYECETPAERDLTPVERAGGVLPMLMTLFGGEPRHVEGASCRRIDFVPVNRRSPAQLAELRRVFDTQTSASVAPLAIRPRTRARELGRPKFRGAARRSSARSGDSPADDGESEPASRRCVVCEADISHRNADAETCSNAHRQVLYRRRKRESGLATQTRSLAEALDRVDLAANREQINSETAAGLRGLVLLTLGNAKPAVKCECVTGARKAAGGWRLLNHRDAEKRQEARDATSRLSSVVWVDPNGDATCPLCGHWRGKLAVTFDDFDALAAAITSNGARGHKPRRTAGPWRTDREQVAA